MPFPSASCQTCKIRRIKCDEAKPTCQKCTKSRRVCLEPSAAKHASFLIHVENCYASGKTKRPRGPRSSMIILGPHSDLQTRAVAYYLQYHLQVLKDVPKISESLSEAVSTWKVSGRSCLMVDLALSSLALAVYSQTQQHPSAAIEASSRYCRLLQIVQARIAELSMQTLDELNVDACLLAITLMGCYEGVTHHLGHLNSSDAPTALQLWSHHDGALAVLKVWNDSLSPKAATFIIKQTRRSLMKSCLLRHLPLPEWILDGSHFGECDPDLGYDRIIVRIVNLHHMSMLLQPTNDLQIAKANKLKDEASVLDEALQDWMSQITGKCLYKQHILPEPGLWPKTHFYSSKVYSYPRPGYGAAWSQLFATRMLIISTRLRALKLSRPNPSLNLIYEKQEQECIAQLKAVADSLASSIPFCLERFTVDKSNASMASIKLNKSDEIKPYLASMAVWPLTIVSRLEGVDDMHQRWFRSELTTLGRITGLAAVELVANS